MSSIPRFPVMLRKMWSGEEVQRWLDENVKPVVEAMEAVMKTVDPATWPGLTADQRCTLGRFAKPQPASATTERELLPCPFCKGAVRFHAEEGECDGCHHIECTNCGAFFDLALAADPENRCTELADLRAVIADLWNRRAALQSAPGQESWSDADINDVTMRVLGGWPSFEAQSWACKVVHAVLREATPPTSATVEAASDEQLNALIAEAQTKCFGILAQFRYVVDRLASQPAQQAEGSLYTALAKAKAELDADYRRSTTPQAEAQAGETFAALNNLIESLEGDCVIEFGKNDAEWFKELRAQLQAANERVRGLELSADGQQMKLLRHENESLRTQLAAQPQAVKWKVVDVRQALPVTDRQDVYPATRYVYKRLYDGDSVCGYAYVELPAFNNDVLVRALRNGKEEG